MGPALLNAGRMCRERGINTDASSLEADSMAREVFATTEGHRVLSAAKLIARLELHGPF